MDCCEFTLHILVKASPNWLAQFSYDECLVGDRGTDYLVDQIETVFFCLIPIRTNNESEPSRTRVVTRVRQYKPKSVPTEATLKREIVPDPNPLKLMTKNPREFMVAFKKA